MNPKQANQMSQQQFVDYLRTQAYWLNHLAAEVADGKEVTCEWAIDVQLPQWKAEREIEEGSKTA